MNYIIAMFLAVGVLTAGDTKPFLLKSIVSGGNGNATLGQVIAGYKNKFHVGIRIPKRVALSVDETNSIGLLAYPNPTNDGVVSFGIDGIASIQVTDVYGRVVMETIGGVSNTITLPNRGVFYIRITTWDRQGYSTKVIFN
jgi:hypothetical protein